MIAQVTSVFLYVDNVEKSLEFYNEIVGAEIAQIHAETAPAPISLAILRIGTFTLMLHPQAPHAPNSPTRASASEFTCNCGSTTSTPFTSIASMKGRS